jgi:hypothetical protein
VGRVARGKVARVADIANRLGSAAGRTRGGRTRQAGEGRARFGHTGGEARQGRAMAQGARVGRGVSLAVRRQSYRLCQRASRPSAPNRGDRVFRRLHRAGCLRSLHPSGRARRALRTGPDPRHNSAQPKAAPRQHISDSQRTPTPAPVAGDPEGGTRAIAHRKTKPHYSGVMFSERRPLRHKSREPST